MNQSVSVLKTTKKKNREHAGDWFNNNGIELNEEKTQALIFSTMYYADINNKKSGVANTK